MSMVRNTTNLLSTPVRNVLQKRAQSVVAGPPINKVSAAEKAVVGGAMAASFLAYPAWVLYHIREYRSGGN